MLFDPASADDASLVRQYRDHDDDAAFAELVARYQARLYAFVLGMVKQQAVAEDLCQTVFVKIALRIAQLDDENKFVSWFYQIARNAVVDWLRKQARHPTESLEDYDTPPVASSPADGTTKATVRSVLNQMTDDDRQIVLLGDLAQLTMTELADALEIGESAAKMRLKRARERFRQIYEEETQ